MKKKILFSLFILVFTYILLGFIKPDFVNHKILLGSNNKVYANYTDSAIYITEGNEVFTLIPEVVSNTNRNIRFRMYSPSTGDFDYKEKNLIIIDEDGVSKEYEGSGNSFSWYNVIFDKTPHKIKIKISYSRKDARDENGGYYEPGETEIKEIDIDEFIAKASAVVTNSFIAPNGTIHQYIPGSQDSYGNINPAIFLIYSPDGKSFLGSYEAFPDANRDLGYVEYSEDSNVIAYGYKVKAMIQFLDDNKYYTYVAKLSDGGNYISNFCRFGWDEFSNKLIFEAVNSLYSDYEIKIYGNNGFRYAERAMLNKYRFYKWSSGTGFERIGTTYTEYLYKYYLGKNKVYREGGSGIYYTLNGENWTYIYRYRSDIPDREGGAYNIVNGGFQYIPYGYGAWGLTNVGNPLIVDTRTINGIEYNKSLTDTYIPANSPPSVTVRYPASGAIYGSGSQIDLQINVSDADNDTLTCKYYVDSETEPRETRTITNTITGQAVSFTSLYSGYLTEGTHTLKFIVSDGRAEAVAQKNITVDNTPPSINAFTLISSQTSITISASAVDNTAGLHSTPYKYTIGSSISSGWTPDTSYTGGSLMSNTLYLVKIEAKDILENISYQEKSVYTKAQTPYLSANTTGENSMNITVSDSNPFYTQYQIMFNDMYVAQNGVLTYTPAWITINGKSMSVTGLTQNTSYQIKAKARNNENIETEYTSEITGITLASPPGNIAFSPSQTSVVIKWDAVSNALSYNLEINGVVNRGISGTSYTHAGLTAETTQSYRISANTVIGTGGWSNLYTVTTYPYPPATPTNLKTDDVKQTYVKLSWEQVIKASQYILEVNGTVVGTYTTTSALHEKLQPDTEYKYRIKAKNIGGESAWSDYISVTTLPNPPETPKNITVRKTNMSVDVTWSSSERAEEYYVKFNGLISSTGNLTEYINENLTALTKCTLQVKAHNRGGDSVWSEVLEFTTNPDKPVTPSNIMATAEKNSATLTWYLVPYAEKYDVEIYSAKTGSTVVKTTEDLSLRNAGLLPGTTYTLRVSARNVTGSSEWSEALTINTLPENDEVNTSITNVIAVVTNTYITLAWDDVDTDAEYVIEVDGVLQDIGKDRVYNHTGLSANEYHTYKVKAKTTTNQEYWCAVLSLSTLPDMPDAPAGIEATAYDNMIELKWVKSLDNVTYDIEVDGETIDNGQNNTYDHTNLNPGTEHTYRVRAKNVTGVTAWSPAVIKSTSVPEYIVECTKDKTFDFSLLASNVQDFTGVKFVITYNPDELEIEDLSSFTPDKEVTANGKINGTKLNITMETGKIIITVTDNIVPGTSWSGELNNIIFRAKINGQSKINIKIE